MKLKLLFPLIFMMLYVGGIKAQTVSTQFGPIQGNLNGTIHEFLGVPFAKPPIDSLRWKAPQDPVNWTTTLNTTSFAPVCPQKRYEQGNDSTYTIEGDEDCLYLNVWTPATGIGTRPVLVFIHGGGNQQGGASQMTGGTEIFYGKNMAERGNAVIVTIQYRLGPLGYLVHAGLEQENSNGKAGNYAVLDQILALDWVHNNIANFGGDPSKVMIFGESAGGVNVGNLLVSPLAAGLFQRACIQSATPVVNNYNDSKTKGTNFVDSFITTGTDAQKIAYMRSLHSDSIIETLSSPLAGGVVQMNWQPSMDNYVFTNFPEQVFQSGTFNKVPLMIGSNSEEMSLSAPVIVTPTLLDIAINLYIPSAYQTQAHTLYPGANNAQAKASYIQLLTDAQFTVTTRRTARCVSLNQTQPVWRYFYTHKHTISQLSNLGSYHGMELFYVFNNWENATGGTGILFHAQDDSVQSAMLKYWVNFADTGDPNGTGLETWPQYQAASDCYLEIKASPDGTQCGLRTAKSDLWDNVIGYTGCTSSVGVQETDVHNTLQIYPNPVNNMLYLNLNKTDKFTVSIYEFTGKKIYSAANTYQIDLSGFSAGVYLVVVELGNEVYHSKIFKN